MASGGAEALSEARELLEHMATTSTTINGHGVRAANIIENMLLHARSGSSVREPAQLNELVESSVALAFHGARAKDEDLELHIDADYDPSAGAAPVSRADISRVLINVVNNACYAMRKKRESGLEGYAPSLQVRTRDLGERVEISLRDNGTGIAHDTLEKVFNPFFTTKPPGEGTGLGLSLSHDIVVQGHQGELRVESVPGEFSEFVITLPRKAPAAEA